MRNRHKYKFTFLKILQIIARNSFNITRNIGDFVYACKLPNATKQ